MAALESLASLLRHHRHAAELTLEQLSEASGVSVRAISNMELGRSLGPQRKTMELIADSLGLEGEDREALLAAAQAGRQRVFEPAPAVLAMPRGLPTSSAGPRRPRSWPGSWMLAAPGPRR